MSRLSEAIFYFRPKVGIFGRDIISDLLVHEDFLKFCKQYPDSEIQINCKLKSDKFDKASMYEYYHKVILSVAIMCFTDQGWSPVDKVKADYLLKNECAKIELFNPKTGELIIHTEDKANMNKDQLHKYMNDCILFLTEEGYTVPEAIRITNPGYTKANSYRKK